MTASFITRTEVNAQFATVTALNAEFVRAQTAEGTLVNSIAALQATNLNMTASFITRTEVNTQFATVTALNAEFVRAQTAEGTLANNIAIVTTNLNNEITNRISLGASVATEVLRAMVAEGNLTTNIAILTANLNNEITTRIALTSNIGNVTTNLAIVTANLNNEITTRVLLGVTLTSDISTLTSNLNTAGTSCVAAQEYWIETNVQVVMAYSSSIVMQILGVGFSAYADPLIQKPFICVFTYLNQSTSSPGRVIASSNASSLSSYFHVECIIPVFVIAFTNSIEISLYKSTGSLCHFNGFIGMYCAV